MIVLEALEFLPCIRLSRVIPVLCFTWKRCLYAGGYNTWDLYVLSPSIIWCRCLPFLLCNRKAAYIIPLHTSFYVYYYWYFWSQIPNTCNTHIGEPRLRTIKNKTNLLKYFRRPSCLCSNKDSKGKHYFAHIFDTVEYTTSKLILRLESMPMSITTNFRLNTPNRSQNTVPHLNTDHFTFTAKNLILIIFREYLPNGSSD